MQFGFRPKHSTETANCHLVEKFKVFLDKGGVVGAVFLDMRKAFHTVNQSPDLCIIPVYFITHNCLVD